MAAPLTSSAASFLMHTSSFSPLRDSQLESSSPSHPLFAHTSGQKSHGSIGQNPWVECKALPTDTEQGGNAVIAQHSPASSLETASSGKAGSKSGSGVVVAATCSTSTCKPSSSLNAAGCIPHASCSVVQMASRASKLTDHFTPRPGSAVNVEEASIAAEAEAASCHLASSLPMLTDYLARQSLSCKGTDQLSCSGPEEMLSVLNSTDLAFLVATEPLQQESDWPRLEPLQLSTSTTVALDSQRFQTNLGNVSRSSCIHIPAHIDDGVDDDDDLVLHDSKSEAGVMSHSQPGGTDASCDKAVFLDGAGCAAAEDCSFPDFTPTVPGKQCWLEDTAPQVQQQDHASSLLNSCASFDSLYADNDWE